jgi:hypothetical protein
MLPNKICRQRIQLMTRSATMLVLLFAACAPAAKAQQPSSPGAFFGRIFTFYHQDWTGTAPEEPAPARRGQPSPLPSPPYPSEDWSYGGSPVIGEPDGNSYPLMQGINENKGRIKLYGWLDPTVNASTSSHRNAPVANDLYSNRLELNQVVLYLERLPDTVQQQHVDIGFHLTALYGTDYRYTIDKGYGVSQLTPHNHQYGFDPALEYVDIYVPKVAQGMNIRIGRFISIPGIEAQLSPNNYFFSHSLLYSVDPFTDTGVLFTTQVNPQWLVQAGITASHDVAPWITSDAKPSFTGCVSYTTRSVNDNFYLCANGINDGEYAFNNLQQYDGTWYHKFGKTWHAATESYVMYQRDVPGVSGPIAPEANTNGAVCRLGLARCFAPEWAVVNYLNRQLGAHDFIGFRSDFLNDKKGQRTGYNTKYTESTVSYNRWVGTTIQLRPELRFDHAWDRAAYDRGTRQNQFTAAADVIFHF